MPQIDPTSLAWMLIGMLLYATWRHMYDKREKLKAALQVQPSVPLYNVYTDHGIYDRFWTEQETDRPIYPNFDVWHDREWYNFSNTDRQIRAYITKDGQLVQIYRKLAYIGKPYRHDEY